LTLLANLVAVTSFYGTWRTEDHYFDDLNENVDLRFRNAALTAVSIRPVTITVYVD
jgi:hypothetical protein